MHGAVQRNRYHGKRQYLFIESICNDPDILAQNYRYKMMYSPDYKTTTEEEVRTSQGSAQPHFGASRSTQCPGCFPRMSTQLPPGLSAGQCGCCSIVPQEGAVHNLLSCGAEPAL